MTTAQEAAIEPADCAVSQPPAVRFRPRLPVDGAAVALALRREVVSLGRWDPRQLPPRTTRSGRERQDVQIQEQQNSPLGVSRGG